MFCPACGIKLNDGEKFCHSCGEPCDVIGNSPEITIHQTQTEKCKCKHCNQHIEFDKKMLGTMVECPSCGLETELHIPVNITSTSQLSAEIKKTSPKLQRNKKIKNRSNERSTNKPPIKLNTNTDINEVRLTGNYKSSRRIITLTFVPFVLIGVHQFFVGIGELGLGKNADFAFLKLMGGFGLAMLSQLLADFFRAVYDISDILNYQKKTQK